MKGLILIATVLCITNFGAAQDDYFPKIQCLFQSDIVIGGEVMRLKSKEIYQNNQNKFVFQVILNDTSSSTFEILAEDFVEGLYLKNLFVTKLKNVYFGFSSPTIEQKDIDEIFRMVAEKKDSASLTDFNKVKLISIIQKAASTPRIRKGVIINTLKPIFNIYKTKKDRDWISDEINKVDPVLQSQYDIIVKNLEDSSDAYLQNINKVINKLRSRGPEIGVLFTMEKINIYQYNNKSKRDSVTDILDIHQVVIKFENSQIIGIKVKGTVVDSTEATVIFQNRVPLSYSTKADTF
ncbi:MAG: hypothetical protein IPN33_12390 [Saprospiraceae bacterium]|nr:hypothetical protein [Saprospiraceae bacterium]